MCSTIASPYKATRGFFFHKFQCPKPISMLCVLSFTFSLKKWKITKSLLPSLAGCLMKNCLNVLNSFLCCNCFTIHFYLFQRKIVWVECWCKYSCLQVQTVKDRYVSKCETFFVSFFPHGGGEFSSSTGFRVLLTA